MISKTFETDSLKCVCVAPEDAKHVVYMIYPEMSVFSERWLGDRASKYRCAICMLEVPGDRWNDWLTPWPEPGEAPGEPPFAGKAEEFLAIIIDRVIPFVEKELMMQEVVERDLIGVSLGGLFTLWQWAECDLFNSIGSLSGSFWYEGFVEWFEKQTFTGKTGKAYFLLGTEEPKSKVKAFQTVGKNTTEVVKSLKTQGVVVEFDWVPGNHFSNPDKRADKALEALLG